MKERDEIGRQGDREKEMSEGGREVGVKGKREGAKLGTGENIESLG